MTDEPSAEDEATEQRARAFFQFLKRGLLFYGALHSEIQGDKAVIATLLLAEDLCESFGLDFREHLQAQLNRVDEDRGEARGA